MADTGHCSSASRAAASSRTSAVYFAWPSAWTANLSGYEDTHIPEPTHRLLSTRIAIYFFPGIASTQLQVDRRLDAAAENARLPADRGLHFHLWEAAQDFVEGDLGLH